MNLNAGFAYDTDREAAIVDNAAELEALLDSVQRRSVELGEPIIALYISEDPPPQRGDDGGLIQLGVNRDRGWLLFSSRPREAWYSLGSTREGAAVEYAYQEGSHVGSVPAAAEIPFEEVKAAVREFQATGQRPTCIEWQPHRQRDEP